YSHSAPDDPIVSPGHAGMSHQHDFFGNRSTDADSTYASLRATGSTCRAPADASAYWVPALLKDGQPVEPLGVKVYYRALGEQDAALVEAFPAEFRMIAGDATATSPQPRTVTRWACRMEEQSAGAVPPDCPAGATLDLHVSFPECWNGELDSPDHRSHVAYGGRGSCPASHPHVLPKLEMIVHYPIDGSGELALASGPIYSAHADFFNAWAPERLSALVSDCLTATERCGPAGLADRGAAAGGRSSRRLFSVP
ncbi:MAG TPA: DUF1996 domain-containing protein, partial [Chloroflexota bacterium]|nr:DUF1996 domain-containing protein [Chloroflexota bacterium]